MKRWVAILKYIGFSFVSSFIQILCLYLTIADFTNIKAWQRDLSLPGPKNNEKQSNFKHLLIHTWRT